MTSYDILPSLNAFFFNSNLSGYLGKSNNPQEIHTSVHQKEISKTKMKNPSSKLMIYFLINSMIIF